jgi:CrcB protein
VLAVALGGALGSVLRFVISTLATNRFGPGFPVGTFVINLSGSFAIGVVAELALTRAFGVSTEVRTFLAVGFLGGYTTFSSFAFESLTLLRDGAPLSALGYSLGSVVLGVIAAYAGLVVARLVTA